MGQLNSDATPKNSSGSDVLGQRHKTKPLFNVPGVFVGFSPKASESDSVRSPTSPLDFRVFSNRANPVRSIQEGHHKSWNPGKVGLRIIDSLDDDDDDSGRAGKIIRSSESKNVLFGPQMRAKVLNFCNPSESPKSLPKSCGVFPSTLIKACNKLGTGDLLGKKARSEHETFGKTISCSLDSARARSHLTNLKNFNPKLSSVKFGSGNGTNLESPPLQLAERDQDILKMGSNSICSTQDVIGTLSAEEIELSEDYTCIKTYGPNPKTTHIFCDCILECHNNNFTSKSDQQKIQVLPPAAVDGGLTCSVTPSRYPSSDFLSLCYSCKKKLEGEDIYMYRGEKAFCSWNCRSQQILIEEAMENNASETNNNDESPGTCIFIAA